MFALVRHGGEGANVLLGYGWIGQEGDRKRVEAELLRKLEPGHDPGGPPPPQLGEKFVFIGIGAGLIVGGVLGLLLGLSVETLTPVFWILILAVCGAVLGGLMGNRLKKRAERAFYSRR